MDPIFENSAEELFEAAPCGYLAAAPDGTIIKVNQTFLSWTGHTREALIGSRTFQQLLSIPGQLYYETHIAPLLQMQGYVREVAFDIVRPAHAVLPVLINCTQKNDARGRPRFITITVFDATDRRQYEQELLKARRAAEEATRIERLAREEAERANRAKDDILALVSHELKTPLSAILGWTQVARRKSAGIPELEQALSVIERNTRLQSRLVDDLLDMSRVVAGKLRLDVQQVELASVLQAALETVRPAALARGVRLGDTLDAGVIVAGDSGRLQQVFWNLLANAVKFTPTGGSVRVTMERVNSHVEVRVVDTGEGMSPDLVQRVFERFRQAQSGEARHTAGLGLGLSLVKHLIEMHGGSIEAKSAGVGAGSTFIVQLPIAVVRSADVGQGAPSEAIARLEGTAASVALHGVRALIVEDDRDARTALWHVLTECGAEVWAAESSAQALSLLERVRPDVLLSDIGMPGEDGYELIRKVRMLGGEVGRVPAIALTALSRLEDRTNALLAGYQIHLGKPVDPRELTVTVASLTGRVALAAS